MRETVRSRESSVKSSQTHSPPSRVASRKRGASICTSPRRRILLPKFQGACKVPGGCRHCVSGLTGALRRYLECGGLRPAKTSGTHTTRPAKASGTHTTRPANPSPVSGVRSVGSIPQAHPGHINRAGVPTPDRDAENASRKPVRDPKSGSRKPNRDPKRGQFILPQRSSSDCAFCAFFLPWERERSKRLAPSQSCGTRVSDFSPVG